MSLTPEELAALRNAIPALGEAIKSVPQLGAELSRLKAQMEGFDVGEMKAAVDRCVEGQKAITDAIRNSKGGLYVPGVESEAKNFSLLKAMIAGKTGRWDRAPLEKEIIDAARKRHGETIAATMKATGAITTMVGNEGANFIPDQVIPEVIGAIYSRSVFVNLEGAEGTTRVRVLDGLLGNPVKIPGFQGGMTAYWTGEGDEYTASQPTTRMVSMSPKKLTGLAVLSEEMIREVSPAFDRLFREDLIRSLAEKLDYTVAFGRGTDNEPRGILHNSDINYFDSSSGVAAIVTSPPAAAANTGDYLTFDMLMDMQGAIEDADLTIDDSWAWISSPRVFRRLKQLKVDSYSGQTTNRAYLLGLPMITSAKLGELIGPYDISNQIPSNDLPGEKALLWPTTSTAEKHSYLFGGNWAEVLLGRWFGLEVLDDGGVSEFRRDLTLLKARMWCDLGFRQSKGIVACPNIRARA